MSVIQDNSKHDNRFKTNEMKENNNYFKINLVRIAIYALIIGVLTILIFSLRKPFNDWSFNADPILFGLYGDFLGGFVGTIFSLVAVFLLYETLKAQQNTIRNQEESLNHQKISSEIERFETTFFNLLRTQQEIANGIKSHFWYLNKNLTVVNSSLVGREFFAYSKNELKKIWECIEKDEYMGSYNEDDVEENLHYIDELYDPSSTQFTHPSDAKDIEESIIENEKLKLAINQYKISKKYWDQVHEKDIIDKLEAIYGLFFQKFHYVIGHYYRHLYHIINFVEQFERSKCDFTGISKKYIDFIQAQMSSYEMMLLFYNAISFPKLLKLLVEHNFLENLAVEDLIDKSHNCITGINLKRRENLLKNK